MGSNLEIRRIELWSLFKLAFIIHAVLGLLVGVIYWLFLMLFGAINSAFISEEIPNLGLLGGFVGILIIPFFAFINGLFGSVFTTIGGWVYNLVAGMAGGLRVSVGEVVETRTAPYAPYTPPGGGAIAGDQPQNRGNVAPAPPEHPEGPGTVS